MNEAKTLSLTTPHGSQDHDVPDTATRVTLKVERPTIATDFVKEAAVLIVAEVSVNGGEFVRVGSFVCGGGEIKHVVGPRAGLPMRESTLSCPLPSGRNRRLRCTSDVRGTVKSNLAVEFR